MLETQEFIIVLKNDTEETRSKLKKLISGTLKYWKSETGIVS